MPDSQGKPNSQPQRVLVVDDQPIASLAISEELRRLGAAVVEAKSADEALTYLAMDSTIDLVFSDIQMLGPLDGFGLARQLRLSHPGLPVVVTSGNAAPQELDTFVFIPKPFDCKAVAQFIMGALSEAAAFYSRDMRLHTTTQNVASETGHDQRDIDRSAKMLIDQYLDRAEELARRRVQSLARQGNVSGVAAWGRIWAAVQELQRPKRPESTSPPLVETGASRGMATAVAGSGGTSCRKPDYEWRK